MYKRLYFIIFLLLFLQPVFGHGDDFIRLSSHANYSYDSKNNKNNFGLDFHFVSLYLNTGIEYKYANYNIQKDNNINGYIGIGYFNAIQLQFGYSTNNYGIIRLRSEWRLSDFGLILNETNDFMENISIKVNIDKAIYCNKSDWFYSIGIGYSWNII